MKWFLNLFTDYRDMEETLWAEKRSAEIYRKLYYTEEDRGYNLMFKINELEGRLSRLEAQQPVRKKNPAPRGGAK